MPSDADRHAMQGALAQARLALAQGEVPVGALVLRHGQVIASGHNAPRARHDPTAHAEIIALRAAAQVLGNYRLDDCELFVTLEPCAMCAAAALHSRLRRVVFGAFDAKAGAAGSIINLFDLPALNHHTTLQGGLLAADCAGLLHDFFRQRRRQTVYAQQDQHLRQDALRTPQARFAALPGYPWPAHYVSDLPSLHRLRLHFLDQGPQDASLTRLCLHDARGWSYQFRRQIARWLEAGERVVAADLIGFGKSDKPKRADFHRLDWHRQVLRELVERLALSQPLPIWPEPEATDDASAGWRLAPFPDAGHAAALRAFQDVGDAWYTLWPT